MLFLFFPPFPQKKQNSKMFFYVHLLFTWMSCQMFPVYIPTNAKGGTIVQRQQWSLPENIQQRVTSEELDWIYHIQGIQGTCSCRLSNYIIFDMCKLYIYSSIFLSNEIFFKFCSALQFSKVSHVNSYNPIINNHFHPYIPLLFSPLLTGNNSRSVSELFCLFYSLVCCIFRFEI